MDLKKMQRKTINYIHNQTPKLTVSASQLSTWQQSRMKWYWIYVEDLIPKETSIPLMVGGVTHTLRELWLQDVYSNEKDKRFNPDLLSNLEQDIMSLYQCTEDQANEVSYHSRRLITSYLTNLAGDPDFTVHHPELHLEKDYGKYILYARLDGLARETQTGYLYRNELKTAGRMDNAYLQGYRRGLQTGISYILMQDLLEEKTHGTLFEILVKTQVPQAVRRPVLVNKWRVQYTRHAVEQNVEAMYRGHIYPSCNCDPFGYKCEYEPLCQSLTSSGNIDRVRDFYTSRKEETERKQHLELFGVKLFEKDGLPKGN